MQSSPSACPLAGEVRATWLTWAIQASSSPSIATWASSTSGEAVRSSAARSVAAACSHSEWTRQVQVLERRTRPPRPLATLMRVRKGTRRSPRTWPVIERPSRSTSISTTDRASKSFSALSQVIAGNKRSMSVRVNGSIASFSSSGPEVDLRLLLSR